MMTQHEPNLCRTYDYRCIRWRVCPGAQYKMSNFLIENSAFSFCSSALKALLCDNCHGIASGLRKQSATCWSIHAAGGATSVAATHCSIIRSGNVD